MTQTIKTNYKDYNNHSIYGGEIDLEDFNTNFPNKKRILNQELANNLQAKIKRKETLRQYKNMTLEELRGKKIISNTDGRPLDTLTDEKWQKEFEVRKLFVAPHAKSVKKLGGKYSRESGKLQDTYDGCTNYQSYCRYINDVLANIRSGQIDYCYYIYQIMDLCRFHYDTLKTKYCCDELGGYWKVWLDVNVK